MKEEQIIETIKNPDKVILGRKGRKIAQKVTSETHLLRIIYELKEDQIEVVTFYPGRRERYED